MLLPCMCAQVLACEHLGEDVGVVTSTSTEDESAYYLNYWELPRRNQQDRYVSTGATAERATPPTLTLVRPRVVVVCRAVDGVFIATMMNRIRVVNPQVSQDRDAIHHPSCFSPALVNWDNC